MFAVKTITWNELCNALAIQRGLPDHSKGREPHEDTIHTLLGSLLIFDRSSLGHGNNPRVKLCHKTIYNFLLQDPEHLLADRSLCDLDQGDLDRIKYFFVNEQDAFVQIGRDCLTLLRYRHYESFANAKAIMNDEDDRENGFLKYAAAFWFVHCIDPNHHSQEDFEDIQRFLQSPNFWACVAVQAASSLISLVAMRKLQKEATIWDSGNLTGAKWTLLEFLCRLGFTNILMDLSWIWISVPL